MILFSFTCLSEANGIFNLSINRERNRSSFSLEKNLSKESKMYLSLVKMKDWFWKQMKLLLMWMTLRYCAISIGNSTVSRGIWDKYREWYFKIHQNISNRLGGEWYLGSFEISRAGIYPKYSKETVLFLVYTTRQRNFALYVTDVIFTCKYFKFGLNTTGRSQSCTF